MATPASSSSAKQLVVGPGGGASYLAFVEKSKADSDIRVCLASSWSEVSASLRTSGAPCLLAYLERSSHVSELIQVIKSHEAKFRSKEIRMVLSVKLPSQVIGLLEKRLSAFGIEEILIEPMDSASYLQKAMKGLQKIWAEPVKKSGAPSLEFSDPLRLRSDYWLFQKGVAKRLAGRWMVHLKGPAPSLARWLPMDPEGNEEGAWQWAPLDASKNEIFQHEEGSWVFWGSRPPEIVGDRWSFTGTRPALGFFKNGECLGWRFQTHSEESLVLAKDSDRALTLSQKIHATWKDKGLAEPLSVGVLIPKEDPSTEFPSSERREDRLKAILMAAPENLPAPAAPTLSPIGLGFLMSELLCIQGLKLEEISQRFCDYLSSALGGMPIELWFCVGGSWKPAFQNQWFANKAQGCVETVARDYEAFSDVSVLVTRVKDHEGSLPIGALVFPDCVTHVLTPEYAASAGKMARGLLLSWIQAEKAQKLAA